MSPHFSRRDFLLSSAAGAGALALTSGRAAEPEQSGKVAFCFVSDTHYFAHKTAPEVLAANSADVTARLVDTLNRLPGMEIPEAAGGGKVLAPRGVLHGGDVIDSGKLVDVLQKAQETEWQGFVKDFGLTGQDGRLKYPVYETYGNHDGPDGKGLAIDAITERNKKRPGLKAISNSGVHYSWDWGHVHFVNLGIVVGGAPGVDRKRFYNALGSFEFLTEDLRDNVGNSGRPVILSHHIDLARFTKGCDPAAPYNNQQWDTCDVAAYHRTISKYNVAAIFYGHTHAPQNHTWDGATGDLKAERGIRLFNVDNSSHFNDKVQGFYYVEIDERELVVREVVTRDRWETCEIGKRWDKTLVAS